MKCAGNVCVRRVEVRKQAHIRTVLHKDTFNLFDHSGGRDSHFPYQWTLHNKMHAMFNDPHSCLHNYGTCGRVVPFKRFMFFSETHNITL